MKKAATQDKNHKGKKRREERRGKEETRELLLSSAMELFARKGYRGTSVRDLASTAGVTTGSLYSNFERKHDIYVAILDRITDSIEEIVGELARDTIEGMKKRRGEPMEYELLSRVIHRLFDEAARHESHLRILLREGPGRDPEFQRQINRVWERFVETTGRALDSYIKAGFAKPYDTTLMARALVPMFIAMCLFDVRTKGRRRGDIVSLLASMLHGGPSLWVTWRELEGEAGEAGLADTK